MSDYFALLGQPCLPGLDQASLEEAFRARARVLHPDAKGSGDGADFVQLNKAFEVLRSPRLRLQYLLGLQNCGSADALDLSELTSLFSRAAEVVRNAKDYLAGGVGHSAISQSIRQVKARRIFDQAGTVLQELEWNHAQASAALQSLNQQWEENRSEATTAAVRLLQKFSFLDRWTGVLREILFQLQNP